MSKPPMWWRTIFGVIQNHPKGGQRGSWGFRTVSSSKTINLMVNKACLHRLMGSILKTTHRVEHAWVCSWQPAMRFKTTRRVENSKNSLSLLTHVDQPEFAGLMSKRMFLKSNVRQLKTQPALSLTASSSEPGAFFLRKTARVGF